MYADGRLEFPASPVLDNRQGPKEWFEAGSPALVGRARAQVEEILASSPETLLDDATDQSIRDGFGIRLARGDGRRAAEAKGPPVLDSQ